MDVRRAHLHLRVSPGARRSRISGRFGDGWKVHVAAPAERGRANDAVLELLGGALGVAPARLAVVAGARSRDKVVAVSGMTDVDARRTLEASLEAER